MGLHQHRAQITADWLDTDTGEISGARVVPADRAGVRRFLERFGAATLRPRWRRQRAGGSLSRSCGGRARRCIWPSRRRRRRGAGTRSAPRTTAPMHSLRELMMVGRLPAPWIPPEQILDLRARVWL